MTSLSAGLLIRDLLVNDAGVAAITDKIFPVVAEDGVALPYICYRRGAFDGAVVKTPGAADTCTVEVMCYAATYAGSIALAEAVRAAMDNAQATYTSGEDASAETLVARSIRLADSEEAWADDAYAQSMTFLVRIN